MAVRKGWTIGALVAVVAAVVVGVGVAQGWFGDGDPGADDTRSGVVVTYEGRVYAASGVEVASAKLGVPVASKVPFQDTTVDLREITGLDPAVTLAAYTPMLSSSLPRPAWTLVSTDAGRGSDPRAYADTAAVLVAP